MATRKTTKPAAKPAAKAAAKPAAKAIGRRSAKAPVRAQLQGVDPELAVGLLDTMYLIRAFDSGLPKLYTAGLTRGSSHAAIGQEAVAAGACSALRPDDLITSTHRGHGHAIAKGADIDRMMAELLGRADGFCRGKGGSMHIADFAAGMLGANGIVGGGFAIAGGAALSTQMSEGHRIVLCFFGDGAINQGAFHEVCNMASIWNLPLVLVCENNQFAMSAVISEMTNIPDLARRADSFGFPGVAVDGMDALAVHREVLTAVDRARAGQGPSLILANCYRFEGHFSGDLLKYRDEEQAKVWLEQDPIRILGEALVQQKVIDTARIVEAQEKADARIAKALDFAKASPMPDPSEAFEDLYV